MVLEVNPPTLIAEGTRVQGALTFFSSTQVFGIVEGELIQQSLEVLQIGKTGWVNGDVTSRGPVLIEGRIDGNVNSATQIRLAPTATVHGKLNAPSIEIKAGAVFEGEMKMKPAAVEAVRKAA